MACVTSMFTRFGSQSLTGGCGSDRGPRTYEQFSSVHRHGWKLPRIFDWHQTKPFLLIFSRELAMDRPLEWGMPHGVRK